MWGRDSPQPVGLAPAGSSGAPPRRRLDGSAAEKGKPSSGYGAGDLLNQAVDLVGEVGPV
jgi:hypothetical protein